MDAASRLRAHAADAFVVELDPATDHVIHLEIEAVKVCAGDAFGAGFRADHVREHLAARRLPDAKITILEKRSQATRLEVRVAQVTD
jgi:hypothetical protein